MPGKLTLEREREWIAVAARAVARLTGELGLTSYTQAAISIGVSKRTMLKLNPDHPGAGLKYETMDIILFRIEKIFREEGHAMEKIAALMLQARWEISCAYYGVLPSAAHASSRHMETEGARQASALSSDSPCRKMLPSDDARHTPDRRAAQDAAANVRRCDDEEKTV